MRLIPTKRDIAFVEYMDEGSATVAKDALHNYKIDGDIKIKASDLHLTFIDTDLISYMFRLHLPENNVFVFCLQLC